MTGITHRSRQTRYSLLQKNVLSVVSSSFVLSRSFQGASFSDGRSIPCPLPLTRVSFLTANSAIPGV
jgi:hypothetical protein